MRLPNVKQRYLNLLIQMKKCTSFTSKQQKQFRVSAAVMPVLKNLGYIKEHNERKGRYKKYSWIGPEPTAEMANEVLFWVNESVKSYITPVSSNHKKTEYPLILVKEGFKINEDEKSEEEQITPSLTEEACIAFLKASKNKYVIYKVVETLEEI